MIEQIGLDQDHIHLLCSFHPKYSVGRMVQKFKSITARELFKTFPELRKELWGKVDPIVKTVKRLTLG
jgi:putative transposase